MPGERLPSPLLPHRLNTDHPPPTTGVGATSVPAFQTRKDGSQGFRKARSGTGQQLPDWARPPASGCRKATFSREARCAQRKRPGNQSLRCLAGASQLFRLHLTDSGFAGNRPTCLLWIKPMAALAQGVLRVRPGLSDPTPPSGPGLDGAGWNSFQSSDGAEPPAPPRVPSADSQPPAPMSLPASSGLDDLDLLGKTLLQQSLPPESQQVRWEKQQPAPRLTLRDLQNKSNCSSTSSSAAGLLHAASPEPPGPPQQPTTTELSLANITVPLESIKPSSILPVTVYDQHGFRVLFHFARDPLPGRSDVLVVVVSMLSTAPQPIRNIVFQSAVPKVMRVKLQPPSGTELPAFNPIVHPSAITQVLLLANPQKEKVRLRYKLLFTMGDQTYNEMGDVDQFPPPETWGSL
ncbi:ADP-ribosylation factor-binding protein GGA1 [Puma concolor]|uniref:ADP-ribosylation factor-binding protein GGA1 n=1 Tax=Puma concolor TaxID=9696 RepID=A0A6P6I373_PUMCO|nr:ADP-ribosylation factor-binding protein GGA1 [Puma concolor]